MLFQTPTQFAILALCLVAGWIFGLASHPGGRKWKARYRAEEAEHRTTRDGIATRDARIRELERERDDAVNRHGTVAPIAAPVSDAPARAGGGFLGWGRDNLSRIHGIDEPTEKALRGEGIKTYAAIAALTPADETALEDRLGFGRGRIAQQQWREQAALLREGREEDHQRRWM